MLISILSDIFVDMVNLLSEYQIYMVVTKCITRLGVSQERPNFLYELFMGIGDRQAWVQN